MTMNRRDLFKYGSRAAAGFALAGAGVGLASAGTPSISKTKKAGLISLSGNTNPYGPSPAVLKVLNEAVVTSNVYGYKAQLDLVELIAKKEGVTSDHIVFGAGSSEILSSSVLAYTRNGGELVSADLTYGLVPKYTAAVGGNVIRVPLDEAMGHDLKAMHHRVSSNTGLVYICNPNNPTGTVLPGDKLRDFCKSLPKETVVLVDEAYVEYGDDFDGTSMVDLVKKGHNVIVTRTFSKIHGLAGLRIGYGIARPDIAKRIGEHKMCMFQGPLGAAAAAVSLNDTKFRDFCRKKAKEGRQVVYDVCDELELEYVRGAGNFVFINPKMSNADFKARMLQKGITAARPFPPKQDWARVSIGTTEEMKVFAEALPEVVGV